MAPLSALLATLLVFSSIGLEVIAQSCYYPNGEVTTADAPCPNSDLCCPLNWQCLSNGLCYDPTNDYYERRTCTDESWQSSECPSFCTYSEGGNEAILLCDSGQYCCDGNRVSFDCCDGTLPPGTDYFDLPNGKVVGSIGSMGAAPTSSAQESSTSISSSSQAETTSTSEPAPTTTSSADTTTAAADSTTTSAKSSSLVSTSITTTASDGSTTAFSTVTAVPDSKPKKDDSFGTGAIIGLAIGVSVLLILCALLAFLLWRRHKKNELRRITTYSQAPSYGDEMKYSDVGVPGPFSPEMTGSPKAASGGTSELYGSSPNVRNSAVSSMTPGSQGYSPNSMVSPVVTNSGGSGGGSGGAYGALRMGQIPEREEPPAAELWGGPVYHQSAQPPQPVYNYKAYRPGVESQGVNAQSQGQMPGFGNAQAYEGT